MAKNQIKVIFSIELLYNKNNIDHEKQFNDLRETIYLFKFLFPYVDDDKNQANLTKNFNNNFLHKPKYLLNGIKNISTPKSTNDNNKITTPQLLNKNLSPEKIKVINDQYSPTRNKQTNNINLNNNKSFDMEVETLILPGTGNSRAAIINNNGVYPQNYNNKLPELSLTIANNPNIENPHSNNNGMGESLINIEEENFQQTLLNDNNQISSRNKLGKPLIPNLRLGNNSGNSNQEGILKINFDLQHKELGEQKISSGKLIFNIY